MHEAGKGEQGGATRLAASGNTAEEVRTPTLRFSDAVALVVGIVLGAGIFRAPSVVAAASRSELGNVLLWLAGGVISIAGAACYAELACAFPGAGGEYTFLRRALGRGPAFFFAWARLTVIPTGSLALLGFVFGDYVSALLPLGEHSSGLWAAAMIVVLTGLNVASIHHGRRAQNLLTLCEVTGLALVIAVGLLWPVTPQAPAEAVPAAASASASWGSALVFVLLAYGGWNEAAYISADVRGGRRHFTLALLVGLGVVTVLYVLANLAYLRGLGLERVVGSEVVAADLFEETLGPRAVWVISAIIAAAALTSGNATILMGARTNYALGRDYRVFGALGRWNGRAQSPVNAMLLQSALALALVAVGSFTRHGFEAMVAYTAPVFWFFFLLSGVSLFVLRYREPDRARPFRVPLYPLTPALFCLTCAYLLFSSLAYTGAGALVGVGVLASGAVPFAVALRRERSRPHEHGGPEP